MGWIRLDDRITEHPKIAAAGPLGFAMFVAGIVYCNRNLTDGFIPRSVVATLLDDEWTDLEGVTWTAAAHSGFRGEDFDCIEVAEHLADVGLFHKVDGNDDVTRYGYRIHDYDDYQPSRAQVLAEREKTAQRVQRHREKRAVARDSSPESNAVSNSVSNALVQPPQPQPQKEVLTGGSSTSDVDPPLANDLKNALAIAKLLKAVGDVDEDGLAKIRGFAARLPEGSLYKVAESVRIQRPTNRVGYAIAALNSELRESAA